MQTAKRPPRPILKHPTETPVEQPTFQPPRRESGYNGALIFSLREAIAANKRLISELEKQLKVEQEKTNQLRP